MAYPQDLVGKFIAYRIDPGGTLTATMRDRVDADGLLSGETVAANAAAYTGPAALGGAFTATNPSWQFTYLKYVAGAITTVQLATGVLTGPMSGCWLFKYRYQDRVHFAHVGTAHNADSDESIAVKTAWRTFAERDDVANVAGFEPFGDFSTPELGAGMLGGNAPTVVGYIAAGGGSAYSMLVVPVPPSMRPPVTPMLKIVAAKSVTPLPWTTISAMRTWRA